MVACAAWLGCGDLKQATGTTGSEGGTTDAGSSGPDDTGALPDPDAGLPSPGDETETAAGVTGETAPPGDDMMPPPPSCGDGSVDPGEVCDDGNDDEADECTTLCAPPSCDDGIRSGAETGIDCGASCDGCLLDDGCGTTGDCMGGLVCGGASTCAWPASCLELVTAWPETESGDWPLDPDGDGQSEHFACDMTLGDAGWTRVLDEDFAAASGDAWSQTMVTTCGNLGQMLGGYGVFGTTTVTRDVPLLSIPHSEARLRARVIKIDSWDEETVTASIDGAQVWSGTYDYDEGPDSQCGENWPDEAHDASGQGSHGAATMTIAFEGSFDQGATNESWGVDDVRVWVR